MNNMRNMNQEEKEKELNYIVANADELQKKYENNYIAVFGREVIDYDKNLQTLERRVEARTNINVKPIIDTVDNVIFMRSLFAIMLGGLK